MDPRIKIINKMINEELLEGKKVLQIEIILLKSIEFFRRFQIKNEKFDCVAAKFFFKTKEIDRNEEKFSGIFFRYLFSHVGLCLLVCGYCVGGAFMFQAIEYDGDMQKREQDKNMSLDIDVSREKLANDLWKYKWADNYEEAVDEWLDEYHNNISSAIANHKYQGLPMGQIVAGWAFPSALLFTVTIVTTIGKISPKNG